MSDAAHADGTEFEELPAETGPERTCIVTRARRAKDALIRFVVAPDRSLIPDIRAKLPGRGAWVLGEAGTIATAVKRKAFSRAFKREVQVPPDLVAIVDGLLEADALQNLSLANKAGLVTCGAVKVEAAIASKPIIGLVHALEAGDDGVRKLQAAARRQRAGEPMRTLQIFASGQLDLALGRTHVIHAALAAGAVSEGFIARSDRLERYRGLRPPSVVGAADEPGDRQDQA